MVHVRSSDASTRWAYEFAQRATAELERRLRDLGVHEGNLSEHDVRRVLLSDGRWQFRLDGRVVLTADPAHHIIE